jgi:hypothetical protein
VPLPLGFIKRIKEIWTIAAKAVQSGGHTK